MAIEQDWRNSSKYYLSPEQESTVEMRSIAWYGADAQTTVCMEECAELIQAISKLKRYNPEDSNNKVSRNELIETCLRKWPTCRYASTCCSQSTN